MWGTEAVFALVKHINVSKMSVFNLCSKTESGEKIKDPNELF